MLSQKSLSWKRERACISYILTSLVSFTSPFPSERTASVLASEKRDTWKRFGVQISFQEGNMFRGFIGLLNVAITQWIQVSRERGAALKTFHLNPCVFGIRKENINEKHFFKCYCATVSSMVAIYIVQIHFFCTWSCGGTKNKRMETT